MKQSKKSERFERTGNFILQGKAKDIFSLLCPVLEYKWLPGWKCTMCYSDSGVAEMDAVFHTKENLGRTAVWTTITYQPHSFIEYLVVSGKDAVIRLSISLKENADNTTHVTWRMLFTATSFLAARVLKDAFTEEKFQKMMRDRKTELNHYLKTGEILKR
jgi:hypothetical protein